VLPERAVRGRIDFSMPSLEPSIPARLSVLSEFCSRPGGGRLEHLLPDALIDACNVALSQGEG